MHCDQSYQVVAFKFPQIYPITDTSMAGISHCEQVKRLIEGGATLIQLREKFASPNSFFDDAAEALEVAHAAKVKLIINDRVDIGLALNADGVHLGQTDMPVDAARRLLGDKPIIGFSTHTVDQIRAALHLPIDYLAFGPVFATTTKQNPDPIAGLKALRKAKSIARSIPVVAIGGINAANLAKIFKAGADAAAVISALFEPPGIVTNVQNLSHLAEKLVQAGAE